MNKTAFVISTALTAFVLLVVGGIAYAVRASASTQTTANSPAMVLEATPDPALEAVLNEREAAYQQMIAEANARLEQAQQQQQALEAQLASLQAQAAPAAALPQTTAITPEEAASIASNYWGLDSVYTVETALVKGETLYQVTFSSGDLVFVSLDGQIAGAIRATQLASLSAQPSRSAGESWEEHEEGHDD
jgi:cell pole-organizing protein PopZ